MVVACVCCQPHGVYTYSPSVHKVLPGSAVYDIVYGICLLAGSGSWYKTEQRLLSGPLRCWVHVCIGTGTVHILACSVLYDLVFRTGLRAVLAYTCTCSEAASLCILHRDHIDKGFVWAGSLYKAVPLCLETRDPGVVVGEVWLASNKGDNTKDNVEQWEQNPRRSH